MGKSEIDIPYGHVRIRCNTCGEVYFVTTRDLKRKSDETHGFFPCTKCGSHATNWEFRPTE